MSIIFVKVNDLNNANDLLSKQNEDISINCPGIGKGKKIKFDTIKKYLKEDYENERLILKYKINHHK